MTGDEPGTARPRYKVLCPNCRVAQPPTNKFCENCGVNIATGRMLSSLSSQIHAPRRDRRLVKPWKWAGISLVCIIGLIVVMKLFVLTN
jgi:hypothetical protein